MELKKGGKKDVDEFLFVQYDFQHAKVTRLGLQLGGLYYHSSVKSKSIMLPAMSLPGRIAGQHNSVKLQYSLTFNFLCVFSHARWARARPKEPHSRIPRPAFKNAHAYSLLQFSWYSEL